MREPAIYKKLASRLYNSINSINNIYTFYNFYEVNNTFYQSHSESPILTSILEHILQLSSCASTLPRSSPSRPPPNSQPPHQHQIGRLGTARVWKQGKYLNPRSQLLALTFHSYKVGAVVCSAGAYVCNRLGHTVGQDVLATSAFCCSATAAAVTASQSEGWVKAWQASANALGNGAKIAGGGLAWGGKWVAHCAVNVCVMIKNTATGGGQPTVRTIDGPVLEDKNLVARYADIDARNPDLIQLGSENTADGGTLEFWGKREVEALNARWGGGTKCVTGTITPKCDNSHNEAENALCDSLIGNVNGYGTQSIDSSWRQVCYKGTDGKCCTSWSGSITGLKYSDLAGNAQTMATSCSNNGISAKMSGLKIDNTCVNQCLNSGHSCGA